MINNRKYLPMAVASVLATTILVASPHAMAKRGHGKFDRIDTNGDGVIELTEMTNAALTKAERKFNRIDADSDGQITFDEFTATRRGGTDLSEHAEEIVQCVADLKESLGSETIQVPSVDKFKSPQEQFDGIDANSDGVIDLTELQSSAVTKATDKFNTLVGFRGSSFSV